MDLDEELTLRIKAVFEDYDDGGSDVGWSQLKAKYPMESTPKFPLYWIMGVAATLLVVFGLWFLKNPAPHAEETQITTGKKQAEKPVMEPTTPQKVQIPTNKEELASKINTDIKKNKPSSYTPKQFHASVNKAAKKREQQGYTLASNQNQENQVKKETNPLNEAGNKAQQIENQQITNHQAIAQVTLNSQKIDTPAVAKEQLAIEKNDVNKVDRPLNQKKTTEEFLKEQTKLIAAKPDRKEKRSNTNNHSYEVFTGTFLNYYGDNDVAVNAGFGLNANLKVSDGIFLSIGAGVSQNKISYHDYVPKTAAMQADLANSPTNGKTFTGLQASTITTNIQLNAQLLSLDLPITLKFYPTKKQNFYLSTGFNSNSYFAQRYNYNYTVVTTASNYLNSRSEHQETEKEKFKGFDFANSAIFAIGINQRLGKTNSLIFEPYFKPAIGNMGDKDLRINTVGLNLKFSFNGADKR